MNFIKKTLSILLTYYTMKTLMSKWTQLKAYKLGIFDRNGKLIIDYKKMSPKQKAQYTMFHRFIYELKRMMEKNTYMKYNVLKSIKGIYRLKESYVMHIDTNQLFEDKVLTETLSTTMSTGVYDNSQATSKGFISVSRSDFDKMLKGQFSKLPKELQKYFQNEVVYEEIAFINDGHYLIFNKK